jgi:hypothetical protein
MLKVISKGIMNMRTHVLVKSNNHIPGTKQMRYRPLSSTAFPGLWKQGVAFPGLSFKFKTTTKV